MKQLLLFGFSCTMGYSIVNAQNLSFFPSRITVAPTWEYYRITNNPNGGFTNVENGISGDVLMDASLYSPSIIRSDAYDGAFENNLPNCIM